MTNPLRYRWVRVVFLVIPICCAAFLQLSPYLMQGLRAVQRASGLYDSPEIREMAEATFAYFQTEEVQRVYLVLLAIATVFVAVCLGRRRRTDYVAPPPPTEEELRRGRR